MYRICPPGIARSKARYPPTRLIRLDPQVCPMSVSGLLGKNPGKAAAWLPERGKIAGCCLEKGYRDQLSVSSTLRLSMTTDLRSLLWWPCGSIDSPVHLPPGLLGHTSWMCVVVHLVCTGDTHNLDPCHRRWAMSSATTSASSLC